MQEPAEGGRDPAGAEKESEPGLDRFAELEVHDLEGLPEPDRIEVTKRSQEELSDLERREKEEEIEGVRQDRLERKLYADRIFKLICFWLVGLFCVLVMEGLHFNYFNLEESVLVAMIGGTTVNVLGIFIIVTKYLFPSSGK